MIITPSQFYRDKLIEWGWNSNQLVYIPNFIHYQTYVPNFNAGSYFLYFGQLAPEKGVDTLIKAAVETSVKLKLAGTGPYEQELRKMIPDDCKTIEFLGFCSGDTLWSLIQQARAVVLPSRNGMKMHPLVYWRLMLLGNRCLVHELVVFLKCSNMKKPACFSNL